MMASARAQIAKEFGVKLRVKSHWANVWCWGRLAKKCNFRGCELLVIDTEGHDCRILRSVIEHCKLSPAEWPQLIQFETMGHCDELEGDDTEWNTIKALIGEGYTLLYYSHHNTIHVHTESSAREARLQAWLGSFWCSDCERQRAFPYYSSNGKDLCQRCSGW